MTRPRIVVTGVGIVSPLALSAEAHFAALNEGRSAVERLEDEDYRNYPRILLAKVRGFDRRVLIPDRMLRKLLSPSPAFALAGATFALTDAGLASHDLTECGLYVGSVCLDANPEAFIPALRESIRGDEVDLSRFATHGMKLVDPLFLVKSLPNAGLCSIAIQHQILGPNANITNGSVSGLQAVIAAMQSLSRGDCEFALAGGYDSLLRMDTIVDHLLGGRLAGGDEDPCRACRPFDRRHSGFALSEGAAFTMLETADHARRRGARIYGELASYGETALPASLLASQDDSAESLCAAAVAAIEESGDKAPSVDCVFGSGLATEWDDAHEAASYNRVFNGPRPPLTCFTGSIGMPGAATGAFSLVHAMLAMRDNVVPPIVNCDDPIGEFGIPFVRKPLAADLDRVLVWNSDRGMKNAAISAARYRN
jgi:3-oxoacyl-[acyl-carrier-protein] synthase II